MIFWKDVMLKIQRSANDTVVFTLSGRIEAEGVTELQRLFDLESAGHRVALDLKDVTLADRDAVKFLLSCEEHGIHLDNSPPYIREWIERVRETKHSGKGEKDHERSVRKRSD
jgi:hypothetical protein